MNAYILTPNCINREVWSTLLRILKIDCIIDFLIYKPEAIDPLSTRNKIFDDITEKVNINDFIPSNYIELPKEKRISLLKNGYENIQEWLVKYSIYNIEYEHNKHEYKEYEEETCTNEMNILIFCPLDYQSSLNYFIQRYYNELYKFRKHICHLIDFIVLDFPQKESFKYNMMNEKIDFYRSWYYKERILNGSHKRSDFMDDQSYLWYLEDVREEKEASKIIWREEFSFDIFKREKKCSRMDNLFMELEQNYNISEQYFFPDNFYFKIMNRRKLHDDERIAELVEKENERFWESENDFW